MAALHVSKQKLSDLKLVIFGAGSAGVGIADQVRDAIAAEGGISKEDAAKQIWYAFFHAFVITGSILTKLQAD